MGKRNADRAQNLMKGAAHMQTENSRTRGLAYGVTAMLAVGTLLYASVAGFAQDHQTSAFARVMATKQFKCGYFVYPPGTYKDPNTGKLSGIYVDTLEAMGGRLGIKIYWAQEVGFTTMVEDLKSMRYDAICAMIWPNASRAPFVEYSIPLFYSGVGVYVKKVGGRIHLVSEINSSTVRIATIEGEMTDIIGNQDFPEAKRVTLPQNTDLSQLLLMVDQEKADVTFVEPFIANQFLASHPGSLENIAQVAPIRVFGNTLMYRKGEFELKSMLDTALTEELLSGAIVKYVKKYPGASEAIYLVARPYAILEK